MQRLATAQHRREGLNSYAHNIVFRLLRRQRRARRLCVKPQHQRTRIVRSETVFHDARPQSPRRAKLGNFLQQITVRVEEERKLRSEVVY